MTLIEDIRRFTPGTRVVIRASGWRGIVVFSNTLGLYSDGFDKADWDYLGEGLMVRYDEVGLVYASKVDEEEIDEPEPDPREA